MKITETQLRKMIKDALFSAIKFYIEDIKKEKIEEELISNSNYSTDNTESKSDNKSFR